MEVIIVSVLKTCKNLEGTCHLLFFLLCDVLRQSACQVLNSLSTYVLFYYILSKYVCMYDGYMPTRSLSQPPSFACGFSYGTPPPSSQFPSFSTNWYRIQQQYLLKMQLSFPFKCTRELFNWRIWFPVKYFTTELACHTICSCKYLLTVINGVIVWDNLGISEHCVPHHL